MIIETVMAWSVFGGSGDGGCGCGDDVGDGCGGCGTTDRWGRDGDDRCGVDSLSEDEPEDEEFDDDELEAAVVGATLLTCGWVPDDIPSSLGVRIDGSAGGSSVCMCVACLSSTGVGIAPRST